MRLTQSDVGNACGVNVSNSYPHSAIMSASPGLSAKHSSPGANRLYLLLALVTFATENALHPLLAPVPHAEVTMDQFRGCDMKGTGRNCRRGVSNHSNDKLLNGASRGVGSAWANPRGKVIGPCSIYWPALSISRNEIDNCITKLVFGPGGH